MSKWTLQECNVHNDVAYKPVYLLRPDRPPIRLFEDRNDITDARLIAAAPDLLEACELVIGSMPATDDLTLEVKRRVAEAIAKTRSAP